jgi:thermitase
MRIVFRTVLIVSLLLGLSVFRSALAAGSQESFPQFATDHILVKYKNGANLLAVNARLGGAVIEQISPLNVQMVKVENGEVAQQIRAYRSDSAVEYAEPDYVLKVIDTPDDSDYYQQWGLTTIQAQAAWEITTGDAGVKVAVLDTGIDQDNEDLAAKIVANQNFSSSPSVDDLYGHGTHVAGIVAAICNNGIGVAGVGYNSSLMNVKVFDDSGNGLDSWAADGIIWAADNGAQVINLSMGGPDDSMTLQNAVDYAWNKGVVVVASAGNNATNTPVYPAYYTNCIAVAATDQNDAKAAYSTYGEWVDVAAPGTHIFSTLPNHLCHLQKNDEFLNYGCLSGTSMSAPFVSGLAALVWSTGYGTSPTVVRSRIENCADLIDGTGLYWQSGRINAYRTLASSATQIVLSPSLNPCLSKQAVTFTAAVTATAPGTGIPGGTVTFRDGIEVLAIQTLNTAGQAFYNTDALPAGSHNISAIYDGSAVYASSTSDILIQDIYLRGDSSGDGVVDMGDVTKLEREILGPDPFTPGADANLDGTIDMGDAIEIERILLGISNLP